MKKVLWLIVCLITMVLSTNAQNYIDNLYGEVTPKETHYWDEAITIGGSLEFGKLSTKRYNEKINFYGFSFIVYNWNGLSVIICYWNIDK